MLKPTIPSNNQIDALRLFIGSASCDSDLAQAIKTKLQRKFKNLIVTCWDDKDAFEQGKYNLENLFKLFSTHEIALFISRGLDRTNFAVTPIEEDVPSMRHNVWFEAGMFKVGLHPLGLKESRRVFFAITEDLKKARGFASDLHGLSTIVFSSKLNKNKAAAQICESLENLILNAKVADRYFYSLIQIDARSLEREALLSSLKMFIGTSEASYIDCISIGGTQGSFDAFLLIKSPNYALTCEFVQTLKNGHLNHAHRTTTSHVFAGEYWQFYQCEVEPTHIALACCRSNHENEFFNSVRDKARNAAQEKSLPDLYITHAGRVFGTFDVFCLVHYSGTGIFPDVRFTRDFFPGFNSITKNVNVFPIIPS